MPLSLADLRQPETVATIRARLISELNSDGVPTDSWIPSEAGGIENIRVDAVAGAIQYWLAGRIAELARDGLLELATGDGLKFYARQRYQIEWNRATKTVQSVALWLVGGSAKNFNPGDLIARSSSTGNRYRLIETIALTPAHTFDTPLFAKFEADAVGSLYTDAAGTIDQLVTAPSGVRCINARGSDFLDARSTGFSSGSVTAVFSVFNVPPPYSSVRLRIKTSGEVGAATFEYSTDGAHTWSVAQVIPPSIDIGGTILTFTNGTAPSFVAGDIITLLVADAIVSRGADDESEASIRTRCRGRWTTLSRNPTAATIELWAHLASQEVDKVFVDADPNTPGAILVTVASAGGPASPVATLDVQDYIGLRLRGYQGVPSPGGGFLSPEEKVQVTSAIPRQIFTQGTVDVPRAKVAEVQIAANTAWIAYLKTIPIGVDTNAVVRVSELIQAVMDAGAVDIQAAKVNFGLSPKLVLNQHEIAVPLDGSSLITDLKWRPV